MSETNLAPAIPLAFLLSFWSCTGLGTVPASLVDLYDRASPDGVIEVEVDRNGTIQEMEADVPTSDLPANVREAASKRLPGATITGAEKELKSVGACWEVKLREMDRNWEVVVDSQGKIVETEQELRREEAPAEVLSAADRAIPGGTFVSVESIETMTAPGKTETCYHVKKTRDGASYKITLAPDGKVLRKVREAKAEIEIPLKN